MEKYIIGKMKDIKFFNGCCKIALIAIMCAFVLNSCLDDATPFSDNYSQEIVIENNLDNGVVVTFVPANITPKLLKREVYCKSTPIGPKEVGNCLYYVSYCGDFFSVSNEMDVIVVDNDVFSTYSIEDIILSADKQLCRCTLDKAKLLLSDAVGRIDVYDNEVKLIFGY